MDNLSYIGLSRQMALHKLMDVTAHNMANMNTPGFKAENMLFTEDVKKGHGGSPGTSQVKSSGGFLDLAQGTLSQTSNKLDFAIQGDGYFAVQTPMGVQYTRAGDFTLNNKGEIVTKSGHTVLNESGSPLVIPTKATQITMTPTGTISTEKGSVGKLKVVTFDNPQAIIGVGDNIFDKGDAKEVPVAKPEVVQGMIESSNVQPILEMNKMIEILRMYQSTQNMLNNDHDMARTMIQHLTRV